MHGIESKRWRWTAVLVAALGAVAVLGMNGDGREPPAAFRSSTLIGAQVPNVPLMSASGETVGLRDDLHGAPSVLFILAAKDCLSCGQFTTEAKIMEGKVQRLRSVFVGVGPDTASVAHYFRQHRVHFLLDPDGTLSSELGVRDTPLAVFLSQEGRVLWADDREGAETLAYPVSRVVLDLSRSLASTRPVNR